MATAGLMSGGTLLALGMTALAAMAGKALMTSLLSLMLTALTALKSGGDHHKSTTYEIVTKPVVSHAHMHTSEVKLTSFFLNLHLKYKILMQGRIVTVYKCE